MSVSARFNQFLENLKLTDNQQALGSGNRESVVSALNLHYYATNNSTANSRFVGSWAKRTRVRPPRDVDVLFSLPSNVHSNYENRSGNRQSQLLQEVRGVLSNCFSNTSIRGDGPVVIVPFTTFTVELIPAFRLTSGQYWIAMTDNGGHYKTADYAAEESSMTKSNSESNGNTRDLIRMMKRWQSYCSVGLKSYFIELLAIDFLPQWGNRGKSSVYYDWMVRDFLDYIYGRRNSWVYAPGTGEAMYLSDGWASKAYTASERARKACDLESSDAAAAGDEWQKIFGGDVPKYV